MQFQTGIYHFKLQFDCVNVVSRERPNVMKRFWTNALAILYWYQMIVGIYTKFQCNYYKDSLIVGLAVILRWSHYTVTRFYCACLLYMFTVPVYCTCLLYMFTVPVYYTCLLYMFIVHIYCTCFTVPVYCTCLLYLFTVHVYCTGLLYLFTVPVYCTCLLSVCQFTLIAFVRNNCFVKYMKKLLWSHVTVIHIHHDLRIMSII